MNESPPGKILTETQGTQETAGQILTGDYMQCEVIVNEDSYKMIRDRNHECSVCGND